MRQRLSATDTRYLRYVVVVWVLFFASTAWAGPRQPGFWAAWAMPKVWLAFLFAVVGLTLLVSGRASRRIRLAFLSMAFLLWGLVPALPLGAFSDGMALHPSPMCMVARPIQFLSMGRAVPPLFAGLLLAVALLSLAGTKLFCGWACPIGAIQELIHAVPLPRGLKWIVPFAISNSVRIGLFVLFLLTLFFSGHYLYDYVNPFHFLEWDFAPASAIVFTAVMVAALFIYRPFCYLVCPLGLVTWVLEQFALTRVRVTADCTHCGRCVTARPCPALDAVVEGRRIRPDCHACGRCIELCKSGLRWR